MNVPRMTIVVPVFNRPAQLRRALESVSAQTLTDFECIVVDDASTDLIQPVVDEFGERFRYIRRETNGGCTAARLEGFRHCRGTYAATLDSDDEFYPWALERAAGLLDENNSADCVTGLYVFPDGFRTRVSGGRLLITPSDFMVSKKQGASDCVGVVRRHVVEHWLAGRTDYFRHDGQMWFRMSLMFNQLYVDEPWGRIHADASDRISSSPDERQYTDFAKFVEQYRSELGTQPCRPLDDYLKNAWINLRRAKKSDEADVVCAWMNERGISTRRAILDVGIRRTQRRLRPARIHTIIKPTEYIPAP